MHWFIKMSKKNNYYGKLNINIFMHERKKKEKMPCMQQHQHNRLALSERRMCLQLCVVLINEKYVLRSERDEYNRRCRPRIFLKNSN